MLVGGELANLHRLQRPDPFGECPSGKALPERPGKHVRIEGEDGGGPGHRRRPPVSAAGSASGQTEDTRCRSPSLHALRSPVTRLAQAGASVTAPAGWAPA